MSKTADLSSVKSPSIKSDPIPMSTKSKSSKTTVAVASASDSGSSRLVWILVGLVIVLAIAVFWMYRRLKDIENRVTNMDRSVEKILSKHEKTLTEKMDQFEKSSVTQRHFIQEKVDELSRTVQQHMEYLRGNIMMSPPPPPQHVVHNNAHVVHELMPTNLSNRPMTLPPNPPPVAVNLDDDLEEELRELEIPQVVIHTTLPTLSTVSTVSTVSTSGSSVAHIEEISDDESEPEEDSNTAIAVNSTNDNESQDII